VAGSRVTLNEAALETVWAAGIMAVHTPVAKFAVWAENTAVARTENLEKKIGALAVEITQATPQAGGEWELVRVRLRGATGIWKGTGKDEVTVNFDTFDEGLIALVGGSGAGKTTLLENSQPYPCLFTRRGKLQDRFRLRDSWREVVYRNHTTGAYVKLVIQIDGLTKRASKYFAYIAPAYQQDNIDLWAWNPVAGVDGNLKPYEDFVNETFGPLDLFLRTAFAAQRAGKHQPELLEATAGEKKALFAALAGVDYLQAFADRALEWQKAETEQAQDAEVTVRIMETAVGRKGAETERLVEAEAALNVARGNLRAVTEQSAATEAALARIREAWEAERLRRQRVEAARAALAATGAEITTLESAVAGYEAAAQARVTHEKALAEYEDLREIVATENTKRQQNLQENLRKKRRYREEKQEFDQRIRLLEKDKGACAMAITTTERDIERLRAEIALFERDAGEIKGQCPTCGQELPRAKRAELAAKREAFCGEIRDRQAKITEIAGQVAMLKQNADRLTDRIAGVAFDTPQPESPVAFDASTLNVVQARLAKLDGERVHVLLAKATEAETRIVGLREQIAARTAAYEKTVLDLAGLEDGTEAGAKLEKNMRRKREQ
jgi:DNA repair exonuclease SbcCD ATPase subunit